MAGARDRGANWEFCQVMTRAPLITRGRFVTCEGQGTPRAGAAQFASSSSSSSSASASARSASWARLEEAYMEVPKLITTITPTATRTADRGISVRPRPAPPRSRRSTTDQERITHGSHDARTEPRAPDAALGDGVVRSIAAQAIGIERRPAVPSDPRIPSGGGALRMAVPRLRIQFRTAPAGRGSYSVGCISAGGRSPSGSILDGLVIEALVVAARTPRSRVRRRT